MRRWSILFIVVAQLGLLAFMAGQREWVLRTGQTVWLRTEPVDPTDPMRGAYVRLGYEFSRVAEERCRDGLAAWFADAQRLRFRDREVFAVLAPGAHGLAEFVALTDRRPATGLYLRGRANSSWNDGPLVVRYGGEALFLQQDKAKDLEVEAARQRWKEGRTIDAEVAVSEAGLAVLVGYRWEPLGITFETELGPLVPGGSGALERERPVVGVTVTLKNHSEAPVAVWVPADTGAAFRLVPSVLWGEQVCRWARPEELQPVPRAGEIRVLEPGQAAALPVDLTQARWTLRWREKEAEPERPVPFVAMGGVPYPGARFALEYQPPPIEAVRGLAGAELLWHGGLRTRTFAASEHRAE